MPRDVIRPDEPLTPDRVTGLLEQAHVLRAGSVTAVRATSIPAFNSIVSRLSLQYSTDAPRDAPEQLILKRMGDGMGEREIAFYRAARPDEGSLARCYAASFDPSDGSSHLLLEDRGSTHEQAVARDDLIAGRGVPRWAALESIVATLGAFHARRWDDPRIGDQVPFDIRPWFADDASIDAHVERRRRELDTLPPSVAAAPLYEGALTALPEVWRRYLRERMEQREGLTLVHGDCYLTQWLVPRAHPGDPVLVDFDSVSAAPGAFDLAFLMTTFWTSVHRSDRERRCLRTYHDSLLAHGVEGYSWEDLLQDYRVMIAFVVFDAVFDHANGSPQTYWDPKMRCLTDAYREWGCEEL